MTAVEDERHEQGRSAQHGESDLQAFAAAVGARDAWALQALANRDIASSAGRQLRAARVLAGVADPLHVKVFDAAADLLAAAQTSR